jgi:hypothetical protein
MARSSTTFQKGQVTNPKGRPKQDPEFQKLLQANTVNSLKTIISFANGECEEESNQLKAAQYIIDRAYGKAPQAINLGDNEGGKFSISVNITQAGKE